MKARLLPNSLLDVNVDYLTISVLFISIHFVAFPFFINSKRGGTIGSCYVNISGYKFLKVFFMLDYLPFLSALLDIVLLCEAGRRQPISIAT